MLIYKTHSYVQTVFSTIFKIAYLCVAGIALLNFNENPIVTVLIAIISLVFFLVTGSDEIKVYSDVIEYKSNSVLKGLTRKKIFRIIDIRSIEVNGTFSTGDELYNPSIGKDKQLNELVIYFKNETNFIVRTDIYIDKLNKAEFEINKILSFCRLR